MKINPKYFDSLRDEDFDRMLTNPHKKPFRNYLFGIFGTYATATSFPVYYSGQFAKQIITLESGKIETVKTNAGDDALIALTPKQITDDHLKQLVLAGRQFASNVKPVGCVYSIILARSIRHLIKFGLTKYYAYNHPAESGFCVMLKSVGEYWLKLVEIPEFEPDDVYVLPLRPYLGHIVDSGYRRAAYANPERMVKLKHHEH